MKRYTRPSSGGRFATFINDDGHPPHAAPVPCNVCRLFDGQFPEESRAEWLARILRTSRYSPTGGPA